MTSKYLATYFTHPELISIDLYIHCCGYWGFVIIKNNFFCRTRYCCMRVEYTYRDVNLLLYCFQFLQLEIELLVLALSAVSNSLTCSWNFRASLLEKWHSYRCCCKNDRTGSQSNRRGWGFRLAVARETSSSNAPSSTSD